MCTSVKVIISSSVSHFLIYDRLYKDISVKEKSLLLRVNDWTQGKSQKGIAPLLVGKRVWGQRRVKGAELVSWLLSEFTGLET